VGPIQDGLDGLLLGGIDDEVGSKMHGRLEATRIEIDNSDFVHAELLRDPQNTNSDRTGPDHNTGLPGDIPALFHDVNGVGKRLDERAFQEGHGTRHSEEAMTGDGNILRQTAMKVQPVNLSIRTDVLLTAQTKLTSTTGDERIDSHCVPEIKTGDLSSKFGNLAAEFVAQDQRRNTLLALSEKSMQVGAANSNGPNPHKGLILPNRGRSKILEFKAARSRVDEGFHNVSTYSKLTNSVNNLLNGAKASLKHT